MARTINRTEDGQIIGGIFSTREKAEKSVEAFKGAGVPIADIQIFNQQAPSEPSEIYTDILMDNGFADSQAHFYGAAIQAGKVLVVVYNVADPAGIIDLFDRLEAEYNPNGSRNVRDDVVGMTVGAAVGAVAGGLAGAVVAGLVGAATGGTVGAVLGGGTGAALGKVAEHKK